MVPAIFGLRIVSGGSNATFRFAALASAWLRCPLLNKFTVQARADLSYLRQQPYSKVASSYLGSLSKMFSTLLKESLRLVLPPSLGYGGQGGDNRTPLCFGLFNFA